ncbi:hypothetical protein JCM12296A_00940 [Desulfosarcina cetonica]
MHFVTGIEIAVSPIHLRQSAESGLAENGTGAQREADGDHKKATQCGIQLLPQGSF